jgi:hypothetical protein
MEFYPPATPVTLELLLSDGSPSQYPQATVYLGAAVEATVDLTHQAQGLYVGSWSPMTIGPYLVVYVTYSDAARTIENTSFPRVQEQWREDPAVSGLWSEALPGAYPAGSAGRILGQLASSVWEELATSHTTPGTLGHGLWRVLGLNHENAFIDNSVFDAQGQLLSCRIRIFNSKANCEAATAGGSETTGLLATYSMAAAYTAPGRLSTYRYLKVA